MSDWVIREALRPEIRDRLLAAMDHDAHLRAIMDRMRDQEVLFDTLNVLVAGLLSMSEERERMLNTLIKNAEERTFQTMVVREGKQR